MANQSKDTVHSNRNNGRGNTNFFPRPKCESSSCRPRRRMSLVQMAREETDLRLVDGYGHPSSSAADISRDRHGSRPNPLFAKASRAIGDLAAQISDAFRHTTSAAAERPKEPPEWERVRQLAEILTRDGALLREFQRYARDGAREAGESPSTPMPVTGAATFHVLREYCLENEGRIRHIQRRKEEEERKLTAASGGRRKQGEERTPQRSAKRRSMDLFKTAIVGSSNASVAAVAPLPHGRGSDEVFRAPRRRSTMDMFSLSMTDTETAEIRPDDDACCDDGRGGGDTFRRRSTMDMFSHSTTDSLRFARRSSCTAAVVGTAFHCASPSIPVLSV